MDLIQSSWFLNKTFSILDNKCRVWNLQEVESIIPKKKKKLLINSNLDRPQIWRCTLYIWKNMKIRTGHHLVQGHGGLDSGLNRRGLMVNLFANWSLHVWNSNSLLSKTKRGWRKGTQLINSLSSLVNFFISLLCYPFIP